MRLITNSFKRRFRENFRSTNQIFKKKNKQAGNITNSLSKHFIKNKNLVFNLEGKRNLELNFIF